MIDDRCSQNYPKKFSEHIAILEDGFPIYKKKNNKRSDLKNRVKAIHELK